MAFARCLFSDMPPSDVESRVHYIYSTAPEEDYGCQRQEWLAKRNAGVAGFLAERGLQGFIERGSQGFTFCKFLVFRYD